ncbi:hypothetical protein AQJ64_41855 [Streptomyces griseoruber]|uniref:Uncharacterized protein n=1 Tax=Streptomyces griseoruber TaxID=1943 RepID=A0A101SKS2_9ACTN|nr:hypothetical protein AQJ64_41855 [Streptomyces griseoruber]
MVMVNMQLRLATSADEVVATIVKLFLTETTGILLRPADGVVARNRQVVPPHPLLKPVTADTKILITPSDTGVGIFTILANRAGEEIEEVIREHAADPNPQH